LSLLSAKVTNLFGAIAVWC